MHLTSINIVLYEKRNNCGQIPPQGKENVKQKQTKTSPGSQSLPFP